MLLGAGSAGLAALPGADRPVAVIGLSDTEGHRIGAIAQAGGSVLASMGTRITLAMPDGPAFFGRMRNLGYVLMIDAQTAGCVTTELQRRI